MVVVTTLPRSGSDEVTRDKLKVAVNQAASVNKKKDLLTETSRLDERARSVRRFDGDVGELAELAKDIYGFDVPTYTRYLRWKYLHNPSGEAVIVVVEDQGRIIGSRVAIPVLMKIGDSVVRASVGGDAMVDQRYRRKGVFSEMLRYSSDETKRAKIQLTCGTTHRKSPTARALFRFGSTLVGDIVILKKYLMPRSAARCLWVYDKVTLPALVKYVYSLVELIWITLFGMVLSSFEHLTKQLVASPTENPIEVREIKPLVFGEEFDALWREIQDSFMVGVVRSKEHLNWRYSNPGYVGSLYARLSYVAFRADQDQRLRGYCTIAYSNLNNLKIARLMDLLATSEQVATALLRETLKRARQDNAHVFMMWRNKRQESVPRNLGILRFLSKEALFRVESSETLSHLVSDLDRWYVTIADMQDGI
jgi:GNAT superfamily N-acetyltransferase